MAHMNIGVCGPHKQPPAHTCLACCECEPNLPRGWLGHEQITGVASVLVA